MDIASIKWCGRRIRVVVVVHIFSMSIFRLGSLFGISIYNDKVVMSMVNIYMLYLLFMPFYFLIWVACVVRKNGRMRGELNQQNLIIFLVDP